MVQRSSGTGMYRCRKQMSKAFDKQLKCSSQIRETNASHNNYTLMYNKTTR